MKKTFLYVDGFNLYYSAVRRTPLRWLNPVALAALCFPHNEVVGLRFFSAKVKTRPGNPGEAQRQTFYWRALRPNAGLKQAASFYQNGVTWAQLAASQFPDTLSDAQGSFHRPPSWK